MHAERAMGLITAVKRAVASTPAFLPSARDMMKVSVNPWIELFVTEGDRQSRVAARFGTTTLNL